MQQRTKTTDEIKILFKTHFINVMRTKVNTDVPISDDVTDEQLCHIYDSLSRSLKRGVWPIVGKAIGKGGDWAAKHYIQSFRRALYKEKLNVFQKGEISTLIENLMQQNQDKSNIVIEVKNQFDNENIFPESLTSFIFQQIQRFQKQVQVLPNVSLLLNSVPKVPMTVESILFPTTDNANEKQNQSEYEEDLFEFESDLSYLFTVEAEDKITENSTNDSFSDFLLQNESIHKEKNDKVNITELSLQLALKMLLERDDSE
ncbi:Conserved_hypothetical protein [Hexamita inflata]|uniref:Uncharacterized protein n=1 Tax=Hexamita inflata TaxID=28002 RepID=A0AA86PY45_9EUKA|nr:Conserved hypothetical protein [Hexamita inflata]